MGARDSSLGKRSIEWGWSFHCRVTGKFVLKVRCIGDVPSVVLSSADWAAQGEATYMAAVCTVKERRRLELLLVSVRSRCVLLLRLSPLGVPTLPSGAALCCLPPAAGSHRMQQVQTQAGAAVAAAEAAPSPLSASSPSPPAWPALLSTSEGTMWQQMARLCPRMATLPALGVNQSLGDLLK